MKISELFDMQKFNQLVTDGFISIRNHDEFPLSILNYTPAAQYDKTLEWGIEMNSCRGLIYNNESLDIVARPFLKFWNYSDERHPETLLENLPDELPLFTDKLDGSMGILYTWNGKNYVATRGSFHSEQADWATNWLQTVFPRLELPKQYTICTEIIYAENRIVIKYESEGLIALGAVNIETGKELPRSELKQYCLAMGFPLVQEFKKTLSECASENIVGREGYVATFPSTGLKIKIKFEEYCRMHRVMTSLNARSIWELLKDNNTDVIHGWMNDETLPAEFKQWLNAVVHGLLKEFNVIQSASEFIFSHRPIVTSRKDMALYFLREENKDYRNILFAMLDERPFAELIWKRIEPVGGQTFKVEGE